MSAGRRETATPVGLGLRAIKGGAVIVGVAVERGEPRIVVSRFLATSVEGDRLSLEPYHVAAEFRRDPQGGASPEAVATVVEGRKRQDQVAADGLRATIRALGEARCKPLVAALLVNRAGWITDLLDYSLAWPEHLPVAEGLALRDALRFALKACRVAYVELDEKSLPDLARQTFDTSSVAIDARLKTLGADAGKPWRKEQKLAALSAWFALTMKR